MSQSEPIDTPIGDPQQTPNKSRYQDMLQSARGGDDKRVFTLNFKKIYYDSYNNPYNTKERIYHNFDYSRFKKIETFDKELANKIRKYVSFHKINLPDDYKKLSEWDCRKLSLLSLDKYVISGDVNKEVVVSDELKQKLLGKTSGNYGRYDFWSNWTNKNARADVTDVTDVNDKPTMNGPVRIDFHFDFSKLKSLVSPGGTGGTRRRIVSRRLKKSHRSVGTRKNRRVYRK